MSERDGPLAVVVARTEPTRPGLYSFGLDPEAGALERLASVPAGDDPKFVAAHPDGRHCYVVDKTDGGSVATVAVEPATGELAVLNRVPSGDDGPCYCSVDATGSVLFVAHYSGGSVSVLPIDDDGRVGEPTAVHEHSGSGADPDRQAAPHPHAVEPGPDNRFVYVPDLGTDRVDAYELAADTGRLRRADDRSVDVPDGTGPRHIAFDPDGTAAYLVGELDSTLLTLARDPATGGLSVVGTTSTLPDGFDGENKPADVAVHPSGRWVFVTNRGHDSIAVFETESDGPARFVGHESTRGSWPRDFALGPRGQFLYAENQNSDRIVNFRVDADGGALEPTGDETAVPRPCGMVLPSTGDAVDPAD